MKQKERIALFDLDGVLLDTEKQYTIFWNSVAEKFFYPPNKSFATDIKGQTLDTIYKTYFPDEKVRQKIEEGLLTLEQEMAYPFIPGAEELLADFKRHGVKMALVTSSGEDKMKQVYRIHPEFKDYFNTVITAKDVSRSKPAPDCYLQGASFFSVPVSQCVVFEDSLNGLCAGRKAGMFVVGLTTTLSYEIVARQADLIIPDFLTFTYESFELLFH